MIFIIVVFFVFATMLAVTSNPDIFSPGKLYLFFFFAFHVGILSVEISTLTAVLVLFVLLIGIWAVVLEAGHGHLIPRAKVPARRSQQANKDYSLLIWAASAPAIFAQLFMIQQFGGMQGYIDSVGLRVVEWAGYGWARQLIVLIVPMNLVYFALGLRQRRSRLWWSIYAVHFLILLAMGALSGSRSSLLNVFLMQFVIYHYLHAAVKARHAALLAVGLLGAAMILGVVRNTVEYDATGFSADSVSFENLSFAAFTYGVEPLEIIATSAFMPLAHGSTFLSLVTNVIPREIWPDKPDSGGVFFTQNYLGDAWLGYSNVTPTFLGEWLINFGWFAGTIGFFVSYGIIFFLCRIYYLRLLKRLNSLRSDLLAIDLVIYVHVILVAVGLMVGEITNVILTFTISQLIPLLGIRYYVRRRTS